MYSVRISPKTIKNDQFWLKVEKLCPAWRNAQRRWAGGGGEKKPGLILGLINDVVESGIL